MIYNDSHFTPTSNRPDEARPAGPDAGRVYGAALLGVAAATLILLGATLELALLGFLQLHLSGSWPASLLLSAAFSAFAVWLHGSDLANTAPLALVAAGLCAIMLARVSAQSKSVLW